MERSSAIFPVKVDPLFYLYIDSARFLTDWLAVFYINIEFQNKFSVDKFVIVPFGIVPAAGGFYNQAFARFVEKSENLSDSPVFAIMFLHNRPAFATRTAFAIKNQQFIHLISIQINGYYFGCRSLPEPPDVRIVNRRTFSGQFFKRYNFFFQ